MFCCHCGTRLPEAAQFCQHCGKGVSLDSPAGLESQAPTTPVVHSPINLPTPKRATKWWYRDTYIVAGIFLFIVSITLGGLILGIYEAARQQTTQATVEKATPEESASASRADDGRLEGNVSLVTNAGDLKPARFAKVRVWRGLHDFYQIFLDGPDFQTPEDQASCRQTVEQTWRGEQGWLLLGETDELGNFSFEKIPAGEYTVEVFGHGGMNVAIWSTDDVPGTKVLVDAGQTTGVKMGHPRASCFDPRHVVSF